MNKFLLIAVIVFAIDHLEKDHLRIGFIDGSEYKPRLMFWTWLICLIIGIITELGS